jgi:hypothetical protein
MQFEIIGAVALASGTVKAGDILDTDSPDCPLSLADCLRMAEDNIVRAIPAAPEKPEARAKKGKETR